jgi:hypothetical protein
MAACSTNVTPEEWEQRQVQRESEIASYPPSTFTRAGLAARYSGATLLDYHVQHGTQIEFLSADGTAYL